jgi:hypothetical protein
LTLDLLSILTRPGNLAFPSNRAVLSEREPPVKAVRQSSGHLVAYGPHGRRMLATDPAGHPLHECEWMIDPGGHVRLVHARVQLDWGRWVGIKPQGLVNRTQLDLSRRPGWQKVTRDDLRTMAARTLGLPLEEVRFFYPDEHLLIDPQGRAAIEHVKDALYVLEQDGFETQPGSVRFMACMGAMHWGDIDFLPVVELFQSLLPGTGSAVFELIRGLYDDQNRGRTPRPLRYRGIPPYPSEAAFKLFSTFFAPQVPAGQEPPFAVFMDTARAHEVTWLPLQDLPLRYFDAAQRLCITVQGGGAQKVTVMDDSAGVSYVRAGPDGFAPCGRAVTYASGRLQLLDGRHSLSFPVRPEWNLTQESMAPPVPGPAVSDWRAFYEGGIPAVDPRAAYAAVLLYPEDDRPIDELPTQPFVADYIEDFWESTPAWAARRAACERILIEGFDAALLACIPLDRPRACRILYTHPAHAQKQAQALWNRLARSKRLHWMPSIRFAPATKARASAYESRYDLLYVWLPFACWGEPATLRTGLELFTSAMGHEAMAFVVGPPHLDGMLKSRGLVLESAQPVEELPTMQMHRSILPQARLQPGVTLFHVLRH